MNQAEFQTCPLCRRTRAILLDRSKIRPFRRCLHCHLVFVPEAFHLSPKEEKAIYDFHENNPEDPGYRAFLSRLTTPLIDSLQSGDRGLDFGCGPGPAIAPMLQEHGIDVSNYDPFYANDARLLEHHYDFVTATEVVEHLRHPSIVFDQLFGLLKPGGILGLMTKTIPELNRFSDWHYTRDLTHIAFYHERTMMYLADRYQRRLEMPRSDVTIFYPQ